MGSVRSIRNEQLIKLHQVSNESGPKLRARVGLVQINNSFSGQNYLPYSAACLQAYVKEHMDPTSEVSFLPMIYKRSPVREIVEALLSADVVGFSVYVWNANISLEIARRLRKERPNIVIVFGGPHVPDKAETFLRTNSFIDIVVHNEGEQSFLKILDVIDTRDWEGTTGTSFLDKKNRFVRTEPTPRMRDLGLLPSPFLNGIFDQLIEENPAEKWIGLWETNRGCPFQCTFCDWGSATAAKVNQFDLERLYLELDWFVDKKIEYIFVCDANFGSLKRDIDISKRVAELRAQTGFPQGFSVQSTKNATERAYVTQKILAEAGLNKGVALSMQSLHASTLENIKRANISLDTYLELASRFTRDKIETYSDLILGLPGETYESYLSGIDQLIQSGQHNRIQFNNLSILPNAEMGDPEYLSKFQMETVTSEIINIHGSRETLDDDVLETQEVVISTFSMDREHWRKARSLSWMIAFLYFDKVAQIPIILFNELTGLGFTKIFDAFMHVNQADHPILHRIIEFFDKEANSIQMGGAEYSYSKDWLGIYWPADEYVFIELTQDNNLADLYSELLSVLLGLGSDGLDQLGKRALEEASLLNLSLISQPFEKGTDTVDCSFNLIEVWRGICEGEPVPLAEIPTAYQIDRDLRSYSDFNTWCREIVWWGNKKGAYLNPVLCVQSRSSYTQGGFDSELAGHF